MVNGEELECHAKILGLTVSSDLKWAAHVEKIVSKATKRLYLRWSSTQNFRYLVFF